MINGHNKLRKHKNILIITEDNSEISALSNIVLKLLFRIYIKLYKNILLNEVKKLKGNNVLLICNGSYTPRVQQQLTVKLYNEVWGNLNWEKIRHASWDITRNWYKEIKNEYMNFATLDDIFLNDVFETRVALHLSRSVISYKVLIEEEIANFKPGKIMYMTLNSPPENFAKEFAINSKIVSEQISKYNPFIIYNFIRKLLWKFEERKIDNNLRSLYKIQDNPPVENLVLIVVSHELHFKTIKPLINELERKNFKVKVVSDLAKIYEISEKFGINKRNIDNFIKYLSFNNSQKIYHKFKKGCIKVIKILPVKTYINNYFKKFFCEKLSQYLGYSSVYSRAANLYIKSEKPKAIIFISDRGTIESSFALTAKLTKTPTFLLSPNTLMALDKTNEYKITDHVLIAGNTIKKELLEIGVPAEKIEVVGDLRFDEYIKNQFDKEQIILKNSLEDKTKYILLISTYVSTSVPYKEKKEAFKLVSSALRSLPGYKLLIKAHPNENIETLRSQLQEWGIQGKVVEGNLQEFIFISEAIAQTFSMSGLEAIVLNKPVLVINPQEIYEKHIPYIKNKAAIGINSSDSFIENIKRLERGGQFKKELLERSRKFCEQYIGMLDGKASLRAADKIIEIIKAS